MIYSDCDNSSFYPKSVLDNLWHYLEKDYSKKDESRYFYYEQNGKILKGQAEYIDTGILNFRTWDEAYSWYWDRETIKLKNIFLAKEDAELAYKVYAKKAMFCLKETIQEYLNKHIDVKNSYYEVSGDRIRDTPFKNDNFSINALNQIHDLFRASYEKELIILSEKYLNLRRNINSISKANNFYEYLIWFYQTYKDEIIKTLEIKTEKEFLAWRYLFNIKGVQLKIFDVVTFGPKNKNQISVELNDSVYVNNSDFYDGSIRFHIKDNSLSLSIQYLDGDKLTDFNITEEMIESGPSLLKLSFPDQLLRWIIT